MSEVNDRIFELAAIASRCAEWRAQGLKVVFTNGVFDILHHGHVAYLEAAAAMGDVLVVGVNDDTSVRRLGKGADRPIVQEGDRLFVLAGLRSVTGVVLFGEDTPVAVITAIQPDVLVKGGDYDADSTNPADPRYIAGSREVRASGGCVTTIDLVPGKSTTAIANKLKG